MKLKVTVEIEADQNFFAEKMGFTGTSIEDMVTESFDQAGKEMPIVINKTEYSWCRTGDGTTTKLTIKAVEL